MNSKDMKNDLENILESYFPKNLGFRLGIFQVVVSIFIFRIIKISKIPLNS